MKFEIKHRWNGSNGYFNTASDMIRTGDLVFTNSNGVSKFYTFVNADNKVTINPL